MPKKKYEAYRISDPSPYPNLKVDKGYAEAKLKEQIEKADQVLSIIASAEELETVKNAHSRWKSYNKDLLLTLFDSPAPSEEHLESCRIHVSYSELRDNLAAYTRAVKKGISNLESIIERLPLYQELVPEPKTIVKSESAITGKTVFIVHGRDDATKDAVARLLEKLDLDCTILHEQPNKGRTIIEKFEDYSSVAFAVVLLTPDDVGGISSNPDKLSPRARQNVIFELGYFIGEIGRERVCALHHKDVELPSDLDGILYVTLDEHGAWNLELAKEIQAAGLDVDLNKLLK